MNYYEAKKQNRIERLRERAEKKQAFAESNGLDLYGEERSGIPMGQPILVGHHSERRHRRTLERIENKVRQGFEAAKEAERLRARAAAAESSRRIDSDNPEAQTLLAQKIAKLEKERDNYKVMNKLVRKYRDVEELAHEIKIVFPETNDPLKMARNLLTPDFAGRIGIPAYVLSNLSSEIRRLKSREHALVAVQSGFQSFEVNGIKVELVEGQVQVDFPWKPNEETRSKLKTSPLVLKWSRFSGRWVRKHTEATASQYFITTLKSVLSEAQP